MIRVFYYFPYINSISFYRSMTLQRRNNDVGPRCVSELYVLGNATDRWRELCHLQYDSFYSRFRSIKWHRYLKPDPNTLSTAVFLVHRYAPNPIRSVVT